MNEPRKPNRSSEKKLEQALRRAKALELRLAGATFEQVGNALGVTRQAAHRTIERILGNLKDEEIAAARHYKLIAIRRNEALLRRLWPQGGSPRTADAIGRVLARLDKLQGNNAPEVIQVDDRRPALSEEERAVRLQAILQAALDRKAKADEAAAQRIREPNDGRPE